MITLIPIEQVSDAHGTLIVDAFNKFFILNGGEKNGDGYGGGDGTGYGYGWCDGRGIGNGWGYGDGGGYGYGNGYGDGWGNGTGDGAEDTGTPEEWHVK